ncbi:Oxidoreductase AflY [Choanephora cucurbitarum]|uniref:Oxidoreductase AflY n=1 Tax=Choanephora cucurbitarum TaxID=101091 RepID=A0A1C7N863_9FUNG|nr:Oxidoreductase AflY [Choanephora cucurbitarum]
MSSFKPTIPSKPEAFTFVAPGISPEAAKLSEQLLIKSDGFHIFFNDKKFHNHLNHHLLAAYSFGASTERLQKIFDINASYQRPMPPSIGEITRENYKQYLGNADAYTSFLSFFKSEIDHFGITETVRRFVWSNDFLARTVGGLYHPLIHIGYGLEFNLPGMAAEGLAMAAMTEDHFLPLIPLQPELNKASIIPSQAQTLAENATSSARGYAAKALDQLTNQLATRLGIADRTATQHYEDSADRSIPATIDTPDYLKHHSLFAIFNHIREDPALQGLFKSTDEVRFKLVLKNEKAVERIRHYVAQWGLTENTIVIQKKMKELYSFVAILAGSTALHPNHPGKLRPSFFLVHALTSVEFLHQFVTRIAPSEAVSLIQAHLAITIVYFLTEGSPKFNLEGLLNYKSPIQSEKFENRWFPVMDASLDQEESHVIKAVRACVVGQIIYGPHDDSRLDDIWFKTAELVVDANGKWDFDGVGFEDTW